jgi:hypothetical protein
MVVKRAKVSYKQMEPIILYFEAESLKIPANLLSNHGMDRWCITHDYQRLLAAYEELERHVEQVEKIKENGLIDQLVVTNNQYDHFY